MLSTSCSLLLVVLLSEAQHTGNTNLGLNSRMVVQSFSLQFVGGMIRPSLLQEAQKFLIHSEQQHSTAHRAYLIVVKQHICA